MLVPSCGRSYCTLMRRLRERYASARVAFRVVINSSYSAAPLVGARRVMSALSRTRVVHPSRGLNHSTVHGFLTVRTRCRGLLFVSTSSLPTGSGCVGGCLPRLKGVILNKHSCEGAGAPSGSLLAGCKAGGRHGEGVAPLPSATPFASPGFAVPQDVLLRVPFGRGVGRCKRRSAVLNVRLVHRGFACCHFSGPMVRARVRSGNRFVTGAGLTVDRLLRLRGDKRCRRLARASPLLHACLGFGGVHLGGVLSRVCTRCNSGVTGRLSAPGPGLHHFTRFGLLCVTRVSRRRYRCSGWGMAR